MRAFKDSIDAHHGAGILRAMKSLLLVLAVVLVGCGEDEAPETEALKLIHKGRGDLANLFRLESALGLNLRNYASAVCIFFVLDAQGMQLGEPEIGEWSASFALDMRAEFQCAASAAGNNQG